MGQIIVLLTARILEGGFITNEASNKVLPKAGSYYELLASNKVLPKAGSYFNNAGTGDIIDGFTIRNGNVSGSYGGGIFCRSSSLYILNCTISGNSVNYSGGIFCWYFFPEGIGDDKNNDGLLAINVTNYETHCKDLKRG